MILSKYIILTLPLAAEKLRRDVFPCIPLENRVVDLVLGLALFTYFWFFLDVVKLSDLLLEKALTLANLLEDTISWLGKVPAGLKLNQELVQFLGLFFKYHIHLFRGMGIQFTLLYRYRSKALFNRGKLYRISRYREF